MEKVTTIEDMEVRSTESRTFDQEVMIDLSPGTECSSYTTVTSVRSIPRYSAYTTKQRSSCLTPAELKDLASQTVGSTLQGSLSFMNFLLL